MARYMVVSMLASTYHIETRNRHIKFSIFGQFCDISAQEKEKIIILNLTETIRD